MANGDGTRITNTSASAPEDWLWLGLEYTSTVRSGTDVPLELVTYFEDGFVFERNIVSFKAQSGNWGFTWLSVGDLLLGPPGQYRVYVYNEGRKLVELEYEITP